MDSIYLLLLGLGFLLVLLSGEWRLAAFYTIFVGFAQDPLRKITPGQPQYMVGLVLLAAAMTMMSLYLKRNKVPFKLAFSWDSALPQYFPIFCWIILIGSVNSFLRSGAVEIPLIGLFVYFSPLLAIWFGFHFATQAGVVVKFLAFYISLVSLYAFTILLSFWGVASPLFREVGSGLLIYLDIGIGTQGHTGLWRTAEIAGWHLGAASCFAIILGVNTKKVLPILLSLALSVAFMGISVLTGRRKVLTMVLGFVVIYAILIALNARRLTRNSFFTALGVIGFSAAIFVLSGGLEELQTGVYGAFFRRGTTVFDEVQTRFATTGISAFGPAFETAGLFGLGTGMTYQDAATSLGVTFTKTAKTWASEGGIGRIIYEIGLVGLAFLSLLIFLLGRLYFRIVRNRQLANSQEYLLILGILAFLGANIPSFSAAGQVYNDFFVLLMLGMNAGFILGLGYLAEVQPAGESAINPPHASTVMGLPSMSARLDRFS